MKKRGLRGIGKRGISTVIVTVLLIVLTLVLVAIVWAVINRLIIGNTEGITLEKLTLDADIESVGVNTTTNNVSILVKRKQGAGEIEGFRFIFYNSTGTEFATTNIALEELASMRFEFHLEMNVSTLIKIALVPLFKSSSGKETLGNVADTYFFRGRETESYVPGGCIPTIGNPCGTAVCGTAVNGTCGQVSCGDCDSGYSCVGGSCVAGCSPQTCISLGYTCGSEYANGTCAGTLDCGTCGTGYSCVSGNCAAGTIIYALSCSNNDVQSAINNANNGDTIIVPAGTCNWDNGTRVLISGNYAYPSININKSIKLIGLSTNIIGNGTGYLIYYSPYDFSQNFALRITGFTFEGNGVRSGIYFGYSGSDLTIQDKIRIDHNTFRNMAGQAIIINGYRGVADNNIFTGTNYTIRFASGDDYDWWQNWQGLVFGSSNNNFYFEDNVINTGEVLTDCQYGNRYAFRYNTITASFPGSYPLIDMHGDVGTASGGCAYRSCFGSEMYGNSITLNNGYSDFRGGKHLVFYNYVSIMSNFWGLRDNESVTAGFEPCECVYCSSTNPQPQHISDSYAWNNRGGSLSGVISPFFSRTFKNCTDLCGYIVNENDEYFNYNPSFDGTTGMGCGTLASRPSTCTIGVGYWATMQSCTNLAGLVGDINTNPTRQTITGTFYKCTATNTWTAYYTPLSYPHPLTLIS